MKNSINETSLSKKNLTSVLNTYESELNQICSSLNPESALYGFLFSARSCVEYALNHIDELK